MRLIVTDEDRHLLDKAFEGFEEKVQEEFVFLREPVQITDAEMSKATDHIRLRLETLGIALLTLRSLAELARQRGFSDEAGLTKMATSLPDDLTEAFIGGDGSSAFHALTGRANDIADRRMAPVWEEIQRVETAAMKEAIDKGNVDSSLDLMNQRLAEAGLQEQRRDLGAEMWDALYNVEHWFLDRLNTLEPVS